MTLADEIIYGTQDNVSRLIQAGEEVNQMDEYGFTPLIETAIVNRIEIAKILLAHGAQINKADLTGRTPLHWAVDNANQALCELFLENKANSNAATLAGEPVMVNPLLRRQNEIRNLLMEYGASLSFTQDFINTKLLGHRFELQGEVDIVNEKGSFIEIEFSGFFLEFTLNIVFDSLERYQNNFSGRQFRFYFDSIRRMMNAFQVASALIRYQQNTLEIQRYKKEIYALLEHQDLLLFPVCYAGHAITLIKYKDLLVKCDRGENSHREGSVNIYKMNKSVLMDNDFIMGLIYKRQTREFIHAGINRVLDLEPLGKIPIEPQTTGNCSWANVDVSISAMLFLLFALDEEYEIEKAMDAATQFYCQWQAWDKDRALDECIQSFNYSNKARQMSKASVLTAILFQTCQAGFASDMARAGKIISVLSKPEYLPLLKVYVDTFTKDASAPTGVHGKNLLKVLEYFDVDLRGL
ncbi:MAG: hypothetical protein A3I12_04500 [Gammaproteobacteria bacterium RIFCSPLOWO2_02_FULL_38_11]|nr:MAG: hypothetical protein A3I12_04500 [Gammaproteobacteria bacterium RIFCSPLOWO2_02_FULL_38_11]OGT76026.1 MAG: hypothetical protein A3G71_05030 [Gammaproteobacteria bacterium RIFCSPLOWO2_12_FULL_38_14]